MKKLKPIISFAQSINLDKDMYFVPISALEGDNVVSSSDNMSWYQEQSLMQILESVEISADKNVQDFRFPVQYVNRPNLDFRGFCGTIASGIVKVGDAIKALPSGRPVKLNKL